jgi:two-component system, cell cycle sensor histidine kinase and response regulator CckA
MPGWETRDPVTEPGVRQLEIARGISRAVLDACPLAVIALDAKSVVLAWNEAATRQYGWAEAEAVGGRCRLVPPHLQDEYEATMERLLRGETLSAVETQRLRKDGALLDIAMWAAPVRDDRGEFVAVVSVQQDITARKRAGQRLADVDQLALGIVELAPAVIFASATDGRYLLVNPAWQTYSQLPPAQVLGRPRAEIWPEDAAQALDDPARQVIETGRTVIGEETVRLPDGPRTFESARFPIFNAQGDLTAVGGISIDITERKRAETALRESEERHRMLVEATPIGMAFGFVAGPRRGLVTAANSAFLRMVGLTTGDLQAGRVQWTEITPLEYCEADERAVAEARRHGSSGLYEKEYVRRDGTRVPVLIALTVMPDRPDEAVAFATDLTERKRAEQALHESESRFRSMFEHAPIGMAMVGLDGVIRLVNAAGAAMIGYTAEELAGMHFDQITHPEERGDHTFFKAAVSGRGPVSIEKRYLRKDGSVLWVHMTGTSVCDATGSPLYVLGQVVDITERRRAAGLLRLSQERLQLALDAANDGLWDANLLTGDVYYSPRYYTMLGYEDGEFPGTYDEFKRRVHPDDLDTLLQVLDSHQRCEDGFTVEFRLRQKSGRYAWILSRGRVMERTPAGEPARIVGTHTDITARKKLEEEFQQVQRLESIGRLAGGVAHDFNNLLTVINAYSSILVDGLKPGDPLREAASEILAAGESAASLTRQMLAFSRKQLLQPEVASLNTAITDIQRMLGRLIGENVDLALSLDPQAGHVLADVRQVQQMIMNLAINARDAMPRGGTLSIETSNASFDEAAALSRVEAAAGNFVMLEVSDTGVGMDDEVKSHLFEPFFTTKEVGTGTGLGLSTVYGWVRQSGGWITVASEPGAGTSFKIYLPRVDAPVSVRPSAPPVDARGRETVLVVEDQPRVRKLAATALRRYGYRVLEAEDGLAALLQCRQAGQAPDLILTDVSMPGMSGPELVERIREICPGARFLLMSGYGEMAAGTAGPDVPLLQKPFTPEALSRAVRETLGQRRSEGSILLVEDDPGVRRLLASMLERAGFEVTESGDGRQAMEKLRQLPQLDLMITDLVMPEQEGLETIRLARQQYPNLKIIAISGAFGGDFLGVAKKFGAQAAVQKPVEREAFLETVRAVLRG